MARGVRRRRTGGKRSRRRSVMGRTKWIALREERHACQLCLENLISLSLCSRPTPSLSSPPIQVSERRGGVKEKAGINRETGGNIWLILSSHLVSFVLSFPLTNAQTLFGSKHCWGMSSYYKSKLSTCGNKWLKRQVIMFNFPCSSIGFQGNRGKTQA